MKTKAICSCAIGHDDELDHGCQRRAPVLAAKCPYRTESFLPEGRDRIVAGETSHHSMTALPRAAEVTERRRDQWAAVDAKVEAKICQARRLLATSERVT